MSPGKELDLIHLLRRRHMHRHIVPFQTPLMPQTFTHMGLSSLRGTPHLERVLEARPQGKSNDTNFCVGCRFKTRPSHRIAFGTTAKTVLNIQEQMSSKKKRRDYFFLQCGAQTTNLNDKLQLFFSIFFFLYQLLFAVSILSMHALYFL